MNNIPTVAVPMRSIKTGHAYRHNLTHLFGGCKHITDIEIDEACAIIRKTRLKHRYK